MGRVGRRRAEGDQAFGSSSTNGHDVFASAASTFETAAARSLTRATVAGWRRVARVALRARAIWSGWEWAARASYSTVTGSVRARHQTRRDSTAAGAGLGGGGEQVCEIRDGD